MSELEVQAAITSAISLLWDTITTTLAKAAETAPLSSASSSSSSSASASVSLPNESLVREHSLRWFIRKIVSIVSGADDRPIAAPSVSEMMPNTRESGRVFGVPVEDLPMVEADGLLVAAPFHAILKEIRSRDITVEGIFRMAGNKRRKGVCPLVESFRSRRTIDTVIGTARGRRKRRALGRYSGFEHSRFLRRI